MHRTIFEGGASDADGEFNRWRWRVTGRCHTPTMRCVFRADDDGGGGGDEAEKQSGGHGNRRVVWRGLRRVLGEQRGGECHIGIHTPAS